MCPDMSLVRARWWPNGRRAHLGQSTEDLRVSVHGPNTSLTTVALYLSPVDSTLSLGHKAGSTRFDDEHLVAGPDETTLPWLSAADVIVRRVGTGQASWPLHGVFARYPGCLIAAIIDSHGCGVGAATGWRAQLVPLEAGADAALPLYASVLHAWLVAGRPLTALHAAHLWAVGGVNVARYGVGVSVYPSPSEAASSVA
jgi:hypothetical protein